MRPRRRSGRFIFAAAARADLREISDYIRRDGPAAARRVREELRAAMRRMASMPGLGHMREDLAAIDPALRFFSVYSYLIIYRTETDPLEVVRILHGARDIRRILGG